MFPLFTSIFIDQTIDKAKHRQLVVVIEVMAGTAATAITDYKVERQAPHDLSTLEF